MRLLLLLVFAGLTLSCSDPTAPRELLGQWTTLEQDLGHGYSRAEDLTFQSDGVLRDRIRLYHNGELESSSEHTYSYHIRNDSLFTWVGTGIPDILNYAGARFNNGRIIVDNGILTITYPWYGPADEPITVTQTFVRRPLCRAMIPNCM